MCVPGRRPRGRLRRVDVSHRAVKRRVALPEEGGGERGAGERTLEIVFRNAEQKLASMRSHYGCIS